MIINTHCNSCDLYKNRQSTSFRGHGISPKAVIFKKNPDKLWRDSSYVANVLGQHTRTIVGLLEYAPKNRVAFMESLAGSFHARNFMLDKKLKEDSKPVLNIYEMIKKPESTHFNIVAKSQMSFDTLEEIFKNATDKKSLEFVQIMQHDILDGSKKSGEHIVKMLKSPNRDSYVASPKEYGSFMKLNSEDENAVKNLDDLIEKGTYNRKTYDSKLTVQEMMKNKHYSLVLGNDSKFIEDNYTEEGKSFLDKFCNDYLAYRRGLSEEDHQDILSMYKTMTPDNEKVRLEIIKKYANVYVGNSAGKSEVRTMKDLFDRIDRDEHAKSFVDKALGDGIKVETMEEFNRIMDIIPPKKAKIFHKNISRIVANTNVNEREQALIVHVENPMYMNPRVEVRNEKTIGPVRKDNYFSKLVKRVENTINIRRYKKVSEHTVISGDNSAAKIVPIVPKKADSDRQRAAVIIPMFEDVISSPSVIGTEDRPLNLVRMLKLSPQSRKLKVKSDINNIIEQKLGEKTLERQQDAYSEKATKIRLNLLPDIFDSIASTRKEQRLAGKKPNVENKDAIKLYNRIQGKNKKLVRYMLKQTDSNNNHIFDIKDIIRFIDSAESEIAQQKKINPDYKAKDAKAYYDGLFDNMVQQHGKLKRTRKTA